MFLAQAAPAILIIFRLSSTPPETRPRSSVPTAHDFVVSEAAVVVGAFVHTQNPANPRETTYFDFGDHKTAAAVDGEKNLGRCEVDDIDPRERPPIDAYEAEQDEREL